MTPPAKRPPTAAQRAVLARLAAGDTLIQPSAGLCGWLAILLTRPEEGIGHQVHPGTFKSLIARRLIVPHEWSVPRRSCAPTDVYWDVTDLGRATLDADGPRGEATAR
jgi:hypothetical protein